MQIIEEKRVENEITVLGNAAIAYGLVDGGIKYTAAYPGTPSTEIMETLIGTFSGQIEAHWSTNEAVAAEEAIGACLTGTDAATMCKSVGLNVAMDPIMTLAYMGTEAALVIVVADDPSMHSSQNEQDNRNIAKFSQLPLFEPSNIQECYDFAREAVQLSRKFKLPVFIRSVTRISHELGVLKRRPPASLPKIEFKKDPNRFTSIPSHARKFKSRKVKLVDELKDYIEEKKYYSEILLDENPEFLVVTSGSSYNYAVEGLKYFELKAHILKLNLTFPFPEKKFIELANKYDKVVVIEELDPYLEETIKVITVNNKLNIEIIGKREGITRMEGELTTEIMLEGLSKALGETYNLPKTIPEDALTLLKMRPPVLCAGCPHRSTYVIFERVFKRKSPVYLNDIGCYSLGVLPPHQTADVLICMGASIPMAVSVSKTQPDKLAVAIIGDSTFWHTGLSGLANAIWQKANIIVFILDNDTTAMTGHQINPSTAHVLDIAKTAEAMGAITRVINPMDYKESVKVLRELVDMQGTRVVVSRYPCILNVVKDTKKKGGLPKLAVIVEENCNSCSLCINIGCPALSWGENGLASVDPVLCTGCEFCVQMCHRDAIKIVDR